MKREREKARGGALVAAGAEGADREGEPSRWRTFSRMSRAVKRL